MRYVNFPFIKCDFPSPLRFCLSEFGKEFLKKQIENVQTEDERLSTILSWTQDSDELKERKYFEDLS